MSEKTYYVKLGVALKDGTWHPFTWNGLATSLGDAQVAATMAARVVIETSDALEGETTEVAFFHVIEIRRA